ncbi:MAG: nucleotidyltransferase family protein [Candidatus Omnitrophica bacterium]|nr:nucleotidyltransferase family protein [Candidatus Omnitrophota bacterium]
MANLNLSEEFGVEERLILQIARWLVGNGEFFGIEGIIRKDINWQKFMGYLRYHELLPCAYPFFKKIPSFLDGQEMGLLRQGYYSCLVHQTRLWQEFKSIADVFTERGVEFVPIKGIAFIADNLYADKTPLRPLCDIDLLINKKTFSLAEKILEDLGYQKCGGLKEEYWKEKGYHLAFIRKDSQRLFYYVEAHWDLDYKRKISQLANLWRRITKPGPETENIFLLSPEDTLFSLALHQRRFGKMLCLKNVCDTAAVLNRYGSNFDWDYVLREAKISQTRVTLYFVLAQIRLLFNMSIPAFVLETLAVPEYKEKLIKKFILKDTFLSNGEPDSDMAGIKNLYLKSHFLLYDNLWEPLRCILNVPQEQFAKFYGLKPYASKTNLLYRIRYLYFLNNIFVILFKVIKKGITFGKNRIKSDSHRRRDSHFCLK